VELRIVAGRGQAPTEESLQVDELTAENTG
jgi:hypothetical protein